jgi:acyl-CoA synthetase (AMP-forming)/AMP-acid ligase II
VLHAYAAALPDAMGCSSADVILPVVPMFHVNAWGLPYVRAMVGAKLVFPGPGAGRQVALRAVRVRRRDPSAGVPTVWQGLLGHVGARA